MKITHSISILLTLLLSAYNIQGQGNELIVEFLAIDSLKYYQFKNDYSNAIILDTTKSTKPGSSFALLIQDERQSFSCRKDYSDCFYYKGFLPTIGCFVLTHCGSLVCETFLIKQNSGEKHSLFSPYDNECQTPLISKDQNQMLLVVSDVFDNESVIALYRKPEGADDFNYKSLDYLVSSQWKIHEVVWVNDSSIALMTYEKYGETYRNKLMNVKYILGQIKN